MKIRVEISGVEQVGEFNDLRARIGGGIDGLLLEDGQGRAARSRNLRRIRQEVHDVIRNLAMINR